MTSTLPFFEYDAYVEPLPRPVPHSEAETSRERQLELQLAQAQRLLLSLRNELNAITAAEHCCICGGRLPTGTPEPAEPPERKPRGASTPPAKDELDELSVDELHQLVDRVFKDKAVAAWSADRALDKQGPRGLNLHRPALLAALKQQETVT